MLGTVYNCCHRLLLTNKGFTSVPFSLNYLGIHKFALMEECHYWNYAVFLVIILANFQDVFAFV